ncbi:hypothetical protein SAMN06269185_1100 [Natronoarchaeum philippinense]|uniref:Uncharacterized protein n=1 Tax=Natronoarchaeum philippinense TaxID=558529 RepID=A0A285NF11_NATPI|nr:DUF5804 family protein [Natronoarchaeum philippinense]SNZ06241.1 hypothetical protein SAMN06269185_1100 [Natronoarchaeum philippinense]
MTRVCLVGSPDVVLRYELLSRETAREALATYDLSEPFENAIALETVSVGAAVSLLNDLNWYLTRFVDTALVRDPSISDDEWLSRELAEAVRNDRVDPAETGTYLKVYGVVEDSDADGAEQAAPAAAASNESAGAAASSDAETDQSGPGKLVEPLYVRRTEGDIPEYDLRDVEETVVVRVRESEFEP